MTPAFQLGKFLIPGWKGESLFSKPANLIKKIQEELWRDALFQFRHLDNLNPSLKRSIHNEYLSFAKTSKYVPNELKNQIEFWKHFRQINSPFESNLKEFMEIYTFRVATVYLYKLMFIVNLADNLPLSLQEKDLMFPHSMLGRLFKKGSSTELKCESLRQNQYSWYRPNPSLSRKVKTLGENFKYLSISQLMKLSTYRGLKKASQNFDFSDQQYSHALSHRGFGLFMNSLLVYFPLWSKRESFSYPVFNEHRLPQVINTKFVGDRLYSISHSHWLAQEFNLKFPWSEILCPEFSGEEFHTGPFIKICHELQFLTFLVKFGKHQNYSIKELLCSVMESKYNTPEADESGQIPLFGRTSDFKKQLACNRLVLTVIDLPKKNPHHYLIQKIHSQKKSLSSHGYLYVFTNQKLFVPSQSQRVQQLLKDFKMEAFFDFEGLAGKGEVANYVYIFKKRTPLKKEVSPLELDPLVLTNSTGPKQEPCLSFRWSGELNLFGKFEFLVSELYQFFKGKGPNSTSLYGKQIDNDLNFEFHQDAIIEGKLLSSTNKDSNNITHPSFFKSLTQSCAPLEGFFTIENISSEEGSKEKDFTSNFLGVDFKKENLFSHILIVDHRDPNFVRLEIAPFQTYKGKRERYGIAFFQYFGLTQKIPNLNINLFREFFNSDLGLQIIQLSLNGGPTKIKSKLKTLLIPSFFAQKDDFNSTLKEALEVFKFSVDKILSSHPKKIEKQMQLGIEILENHGMNTPWMTLGLISHFKFNLLKVMEKIGDGTCGINYSNPLILQPLLNLESQPIYPNEDIFLDFQIKTREDLKLPLENIELKEAGKDSSLNLYSNKRILIKLYSDPELLKFTEFLLQSVKEKPINTVIQNLRLPPLKELKEVLNQYQLIEQASKNGLSDSANFVQKFFNQILTKP